MSIILHIWWSPGIICTVVPTRVLARPFPKGTVSFGAPNVPFRSAQKPIMCPLVPPHIFNSHLNYLNLKLVWAPNIEPSEH